MLLYCKVLPTIFGGHLVEILL